MNNTTPWWKKSVVYQIYPRSFYDSNADGYGDLDGITSKLPYLKTLGVDVLLLNPICVSPQVDNGYDISDYRDIDPRFGGMAAFERLLGAAHTAGLRVMIDLALNHSSSEHPWFKAAKSSRENPYHDYYIWKDVVPNNWGSSFGGSTWEYVPEVGQYYLHLFAKEQPDLNWENPAVREEVKSILRYWLDKGVDGFRLDVITLVSKDPAYPDGPVIQNKAYGSYYAGCATGPRAHEFIHELYKDVFCKYDCIIVGEAPHTGADEAALYTGAARGELQTVFHFDHMHLDYGENGKYCTNRVKLTDLKRVFTEWQDKLAACDGWNALYWSNPDQARPVTRFGNDTPEYRVQSAKMLGTLLHMMQGTPYIYEGEELGMTNANFQTIAEYRDIEALDTYHDFTTRKGFSSEDTLHLLHLKSRDNARTPMQWSGEVNAGFTAGTPWIAVNPNYKTINAAACLADENSVLYYYRKLIELRHTLPVVTEGVYKLLDPDNEKIYAFLREGEDETLVVVLNFTSETLHYAFNAVAYGESRLLISNCADAPNQMPDELTLPPYGAFVYAIR